MKKNLEEYLTTPPSDPLPPKPYVPKAKPQAKAIDAQIAKRPPREEETNDPRPQDNQLPPGLPPGPGNAPQKLNGAEGQKEKR